MGASHGETCSNFIVFSDHFLQGPLDIWEAFPHHLDDRKVTSRPSHWLRAPGYIENCVRRYKLCGKRLAGNVDKLNKATHDKLVGLCCHWIISFESKNNLIVACCDAFTGDM